MTILLQDLRYGIRMMRKSPGVTVAVLLSLALGIGANTAIFTMVDRVMLRRLPVQEPERLVAFVEAGARRSNSIFSYPFYADLRERNDVFSGLIAYNPQTALSLSIGGQTERIFGQMVSGDYFSVLGVRAALGRTFVPDEDRTPGAHPVAVVSHGLWQRRFGQDPALVGKSLVLNGHSFTVVGIAPAEFTGTVRGSSPEIFLPMTMQAEAQPGRGGKITSRNDGWIHLMGRLKPEVSSEQAQTQLTALAAQIKQDFPRTVDPDRISLAPGSKGNTDRVRDLSLPLILVMIVVGLVLLIACGNVANLLLARAGTRRKEIAVRLALGASRGRMCRQLLTESLLLSFLGGGIGLLVAIWLTDALLSFRPPTNSIPLTLDGRVDLRVLGFTLLSSLLTGILFGLAPAIQGSRPELVSSLKEETPLPWHNLRRMSLRNLLVVAQVALSVMVLIGAGLCIRSLQKLQAIDAGFEPAKVLILSLDLSLSGYDPARGQQLYPKLVERISALPGIEAVSLANIVPLGDSLSTRSAEIEGYNPQPGERMTFYYNAVGPRYFQTMGISLVRGREFNAEDTAGVAIINETVARRYFPGKDPLGGHIRRGRQLAEIVGIARDSKYRTLSEDPLPTLYMPLLRNYTPFVTLHVRTAGDPKTLLAAVRREVESLDPNLSAFNIKTLDEQKSSSLYTENMAATLLSGFGILALMLSAVGIFGVMAYVVDRRTREIGIRMALGAQRQEVLKEVLNEGMVLALAGLVLGLGGAMAATRLLSSFLYGVTPTDPVTLVLIPVILISVAFLANYIPARRAARIDPMVALRYE